MNESMNRYTYNPVSKGNKKRSTFDMSHTLNTTFNTGELVPIYCEEVLPGDTVTLDTGMLARMSTPIFPVMDDLYMDELFFAVPCRLVWDHWKEFNGENTTGPFAQTTEYTIPTVELGNDVNSSSSNEQFTSINEVVGTLWDKFNLPLNAFEDGNADGTGNLKVNALPFRSYWLIWNEWFRDENTQYPIFFDKGDAPLVLHRNANLCHLQKSNKFHDYFTSALPQPQKGDPVTIELGGLAPIYTGDINPDITEHGGNLQFYSPNTLTDKPLAFKANGYDSFDLGVGSQSTPGVTSANAVPSNLWADLSKVTALTINELRYAEALQTVLERDALGGTRYTEMIKAHFDVTSPDARQQRPEYLGGKRIPINIAPVLQQSGTQMDSTGEATKGATPLGAVGGMSQTSDRDNSFTYSATEHCYIIGLVVVRTAQSYQQGTRRMWTRKRRFDFYLPALANIGEQPIYNKELYFEADPDIDNGVFGYQEAWADYRYHPNAVNGMFRSNISKSLDVWHYANNFKTTPVLNSDFMLQGEETVDRTLAIPHDTNGPDQFICNFYFDCKITRIMPLYSIPSLTGWM